MADEPVQPLRFRVQETLPDLFLFHIGAYLQTCAHIEVAACRFVCLVEGLNPTLKGWDLRFNELRKKRTSDLIAITKKRTKRLPDHRRADFLGFVEWVESYSANRHIAAHGAFYFSSEPGFLKVLYTHKKVIDDEPCYYTEPREIDRDYALLALEDADRILRTFEGLNSAIENCEIMIRDVP